MTRGLAFWILMLLWIVLSAAWHFSFYPVVATAGLMVVPFLLLVLLGWQVFGPPVRLSP